MATMRQKKAIKITSENLRKGKPIKMGEIMLKSGYSNSVSKHPDILTKSKAWEEIMREIDWNKHLIELDEMASIQNNNDKDNVLKSKDMLFKLGDKYPAQKSKIIGLFDKLNMLEE